MINNKSVLAITLARGGSKGIPKKNIVDIHGKPLLQYTTDEIVKSKYIDDYVVSTDSDEIEKVCNELNVNVFRRKRASNTQTTADGLLEVLESYKKYDYVVEVMCTNPLKTIEDIDNVIEKLNRTGADSVVSVVRVWDNHPLRIKYIENDKLMNFYGDENPDIPNTRRQDLTPPAYVRNGSIYAMTYEQMVGKGLRIGKDVRPYIMDEQNSINLDEPLDLEIAKIKIRSLIDE